MVRTHGHNGFYFDHPLFGLNSKMNDMEASIGLGKLEQFDETFSLRHSIVTRMRNELSQYRDIAWFSEEDANHINCPHGFSITVKKPGLRDIVTSILDQANIHWKRNFGCIPTQHGAFKYLGYTIGEFPDSEYVGDNGIHIGTHKYLSDNDVSYIISNVSIAMDMILRM